MEEVCWFIAYQWVFPALIFWGVMWCIGKIRAKRNQPPIFYFDSQDRRMIFDFSVLYMVELGYLYTLADKYYLDKILPKLRNYLDALLLFIMFLSSLVLAIQFRKHWKAQSKDKVGVIIFLSVLQTALSMIVANDHQLIIARLVSNIIYLVLPAYIIHSLSIKP